MITTTAMKTQWPAQAPTLSTRSSPRHNQFRFRDPVLTVLSLMLVLAILPTVSSTITIAGTGEHFPSRPDRIVGNGWMDGFEYMARMQLIESHPDLCPPDSNPNATITITPPSDGLPVVLLVKGDSCSDTIKVEFALSRIRPKGIVKYLIIYSAPSVLEDTRSIIPYPESTSHILQHASRLDEYPTDWQFLAYQHSDRSGGHGRSLLGDGDDYLNRMGVLRVSANTGNDLLSIIRFQDSATKESGGPRVLLDGKSSPDHPFLRNLLFWIGLSLMMSGCVISFCLSLWLQDAAVPTPVVQPDRRRLTREQVEAWLPEYQLMLEGNKGSGDNDDDDGASDATPCECSICLDDLLHGDHVRRLPCNHMYHSNCIAKWLVERHSTCPLCKLDLMPDEDENDNDDDDDEAVSVIENSDADRHEADLDSNRASVVQLLIGNFPWRRATMQSVEIEQGDSTTVDPTPLLQGHSSHDQDHDNDA